MTQHPLRWTLVFATFLLGAPASLGAQQTVEYQEPPAEYGQDGQVVQEGVPTVASGPERVRLALYGGVDWGGRARQSSPGFADVAQNLGPAPTLGARLELPLGQALVLGGFLDFVSIQMRNPLPGADRVSLVAAGLWAKIRMVAALQRSLIELYVGVPIGVSIWIPPSSSFDTQAGLSLGALGGAQAHITPRFAIFAEAGFRFDYFSVSGTETTYFQATARGGLSLGF